jgi:hypothetical protein
MDMQQMLEVLLANQAEMMAEMNAKMDGKQEDMQARMREDIKSGQAEMRSTSRTFWSELKETIQYVMRAAIQHVWSELAETSACNEVTETKPDPGKMQSTEEHQEIPKGEAVVMLVGEPRKRHRIWNLATVCCQKMKQRTRGNSGSRRKSAAACRKVAWRKRNPFRNVRALEKCGQRKEFITGIRTTRCTKVAWHKERSHEGLSVEQG